VSDASRDRLLNKTVVPSDQVRLVVVALARAEAEVSAVESSMAFAEARLGSLGAAIATLKALAYETGVLSPPALVQPALASPPPIDDLTRAKARLSLARSGFVRVTR